ncbi:uncharacterized protein LOC110446789 [Mizuhopecten yessoensis]|uniref:uncharacterized protein LOC110446789 n=1 Tax=Mizuhopecten yessoensis TaxID=6573 RepID=UPI000B45AB68|nr:uncharacterized protein LOC110446789 [Mizuhopecten yessoensis]
MSIFQKEDYNAADAVFASGVESRTQSTPVQHSKYTETMDQILNTPAALSVLSMGYSKDMVCKAVERCLQSGKTKLSATEIMTVIIDMEEEEEIGENLETENVLSETKCENVSEKECEIEHDKREKEIDFVNHHISDSKMYSQCTEEPLSGQNTIYT